MSKSYNTFYSFIYIPQKIFHVNGTVGRNLEHYNSCLKKYLHLPTYHLKKPQVMQMYHIIDGEKHCTLIVSTLKTPSF